MHMAEVLQTYQQLLQLQLQMEQKVFDDSDDDDISGESPLFNPNRPTGLHLPDDFHVNPDTAEMDFSSCFSLIAY